MPPITVLVAVMLNIRNIEGSLKLYTEALGMEVPIHKRKLYMAFLSFGTEQRVIALVQAIDTQESRTGMIARAR